MVVACGATAYRFAYESDWFQRKPLMQDGYLQETLPRQEEKSNCICLDTGRLIAGLLSFPLPTHHHLTQHQLLLQLLSATADATTGKKTHLEGREYSVIKEDMDEANAAPYTTVSYA